MLKIDPTLQQIGVARQNVVTLLESVNSPLVNIPAHGTASTSAYVVGAVGGPGAYRVYVYLRQPDNGNAVTIYVSDPADLSAEQYRIEESEAVRFLESMGFVMDNRNFRALTDEAQVREINRVGLFAPKRASVFDLVDPVSVAPGPQVHDPESEDSLAGPSEIFGGFSKEQRDVFRRAGVLTTPPKAAHAEPLATVRPLPIPEPSSVGPRPAAQLTPLPAAELTPLPPLDVTPPQPTVRPRSNPGDRDPEALSRLGRLLSTFCVLGVVTATAACHNRPDPSEPIPPGVRTEIDIGNNQLQNHHYAPAIATFEKVIAEWPYARDALYGAGISYLNLGRVDTAENYMRRAVDADPKWSVAKNALASLLIQRQQCAEADELLDVVLGDIFYATPWYAQHNKALALRCLGKKRPAIARLQSLVDSQPKFCLGYLTLAEMSADEKMHELTIDVCSRFAKECEAHEQIRKLVSPEHSCLCYFLTGHAHAELGDIESARASFSSCESNGRYGKECRASLGLLPR